MARHRIPDDRLTRIELDEHLEASLLRTGFHRTLDGPTETWTIHAPDDRYSPVLQVTLYRPSKSNPQGMWLAWTGGTTRRDMRDLAYNLESRRNEASKLSGDCPRVNRMKCPK
jgi:hypothetical protein